MSRYTTLAQLLAQPGALDADDAAEVERITRGEYPRPHELDPDPERKPTMISVVEADEIDRLTKG